MEQHYMVLEDYLNSERVVKCEKCKEQLPESKLAKNAFV